MWESIGAVLVVVAVMAGTFLIEPIFPLGDWRWAVVLVATALAAAWAYKKSEGKRITGDGARVATWIMGTRNLRKAESLFNRFMKLRTRQYTERVKYAFYMRLNSQDPSRAEQFLEANPDLNCYEVWKDTLEDDDFWLDPWWKRVWERVRW